MMANFETSWEQLGIEPLTHDPRTHIAVHGDGDGGGDGDDDGDGMIMEMVLFMVLLLPGLHIVVS